MKEHGAGREARLFLLGSAERLCEEETNERDSRLDGVTAGELAELCTARMWH